MRRNFAKLPIMLNGFLFALLFLVLFTIALKIYNPQKKKTIIHEDLKDDLLKAIDGLTDPETAKIIFSQSAHETADFTSKIFLENNNAFGMRFPHVRKTTAIEERNGYAYYRSLEDSVKDLFLWFDYNNIIPERYGSTRSYIAILKEHGYFQDSRDNYNKGVGYFYKKYFLS